jgi:23S rRNA (cytosine1962-C5)-methyltransferase
MNLKLNLQGAKKAASGMPWITVKDLEHFKQPPPAGEILRLQDSLGNFLAHAVSEGPGAVLVCRVLSRLRHPEFDAPYFEAAVETALRRRKALMQEDAGVRLLHGECDELPGVFCDRHGKEGVLLVDVQSPGMRAFAPWIEAALWKQAGAKSLWRRQGGGWLRIHGKAAGPKIKSRVAGMNFWVRLAEEAPADFDLEQRMHYARLGEWALKGEALIAFSRRGAWAAAALRAGCARVACLERDAALSAAAAENLELNGFQDRADFVGGDALEHLEKLKGQGKRYGFVMAEMPRKSKGSRLNFQAARHGAGLVAKVLGLLAPGGVAAFSLASSELSAASFQAALNRGLTESGLQAESLAPAGKAPDFPELAGFEFDISRRFLALKLKALS